MGSGIPRSDAPVSPPLTPPRPSSPPALAPGPVAGPIAGTTAVATGPPRSLLPQDEVERPAPADMLPRPAQVGQERGVGAAGLLQGVPQQRHLLEPPLLVQRSGQSDRGRRPPGGVEGHGPEGVAEHLPDQAALGYTPRYFAARRRQTNSQPTRPASRRPPPLLPPPTPWRRHPPYEV